MTRLLLVTGTVLLLAACGSGPAVEPPAAPQPGAAPTAPPPSAAPAASRPGAAAAAQGLSPAEASFVERARQIAPKIVGSDEGLADRATNSCSTLADPDKPRSWVTDQAVVRFSSGSYAVTRSEAERLVEAARATVCAPR